MNVFSSESQTRDHTGAKMTLDFMYVSFVTHSGINIIVLQFLPNNNSGWNITSPISP